MVTILTTKRRLVQFANCARAVKLK